MKTKNQEFFALLTSENAENLAKYIANNIGLKTDEMERTVEVDFHLKEGNMEKKESQETNTWVKFDTKENTLCRQILDFLCDEEVEPEETLLEQSEDFRQLTEEMLQNKYSDIIKEKIKQTVFPDTPPQIFPMKDFKVMFLEIAEKPKIDYTLSVKKEAPKDYISTPVANELIQEHLSTGEEYETIIKRKQEEGNEAYKYVIGVTKNKAFYEVNLDLYIDYSIDPSLLMNK